MRVFAISDLHLDYEQNQSWLRGLSQTDYLQDVLILAGDISDRLSILTLCFEQLERRFKQVLFVPGNHDLWTRRDEEKLTSFDKFDRVSELALNCGISMNSAHYDTLSIIPLLSWYDFSFGQPTDQLLQTWMDFRSCEWGSEIEPAGITQHFLALNEAVLQSKNETIITFSHFLPRIDVMPSFIPLSMQYLYPVLGSSLIDEQVRELSSSFHVYGHSHVNQDIMIDGVRYFNNAFGYPSEEHLSFKKLRCIYEC